MSSARRVLAIRDLVPSPDPMRRVGRQDGEQDAHRRAQAQLCRRFRSFHSEVFLSTVLVVNGQEVVVQGRLDGFRRIRGGVALCEIKPVPGSPREWIGRPELCGARRQLLLYADLAARVSSPPWGDVPITTLELLLAGSDGKVAREPLSLHNAHGTLERRLKVCLPTDVVAEPEWRQRQRFELFAASDSRHDRGEQREALARLRRAQGARVLLSMPPGSGKTRVALRHALRMAFEHALPLYWITTKIRGREIVIEELERYRKAGVPLRIVWKTVAARTCSCPRADVSCPLRIAAEERFFWNGLPLQLATDSWSVEDALNVARDENLCPHELLRHAESSADVIVADLNYLIGSSSLHGRKAVLVVDEAQNLSRRTREYFEAAVPLDDLLGLSRRLSAAARRELRRLLPGPQSDDDHEVNPQRWLALLEPAHDRGLLDDPHRKFLAVLHLWERVPADVIFAWYHGGGTPVLLGAPLRLERILDAALTPFPFVLALSGSLPADATVRESLFPGASRFDCVEVNPSHAPAVFLCPQLDFKHPISMQDHQAATELLQQVLTSLGGTVLVFGQNRSSNEILGARLRVRGSTSLLDEDVGEDWATLRAAQPDFLLVALGGSLAESVNPPPDVFSCAVVLAAGFAAPDPFSRLRQNYCNPSEDAGEPYEPVTVDRIAETASRIIQAVGRVQRDPMRMKPAFLLATSFAAAPFQRAWPQAWRAAEERELPCWNFAEALVAAARVSHAT